MQTATLSTTEPHTEPGAGIIYARVLSELDYEARGGFIYTPDEKQPFSPGDSLVVDATGEWPIDATRLRTDYRRLGAAESSGFARYLYVGQPKKDVSVAGSPAGESPEPLATAITAWGTQT